MHAWHVLRPLPSLPNLRLTEEKQTGKIILASARLNTEIKNLEKEVAANQNALDKATAIRQKQLAEFNGEDLCDPCPRKATTYATWYESMKFLTKSMLQSL